MANLSELPEYQDEPKVNKDVSHCSYIMFETSLDLTEVVWCTNLKTLGETDEIRKEYCKKIMKQNLDGILTRKVIYYDRETKERTEVVRHYAVYENEDHSMFKPTASDSISSGNMTPATVTIEFRFQFEELHRYVTKEFKTRNCNVWSLVESTIEDYIDELPLEYFDESDSPIDESGYFLRCYDNVYDEELVHIETEQQIEDALIGFRLVDVQYIFDETK